MSPASDARPRRWRCPSCRAEGPVGLAYLRHRLRCDPGGFGVELLVKAVLVGVGAVLGLLIVSVVFGLIRLLFRS